MVEQKIKELQGTKTIIHIDNPDHYDLILNNISFEQTWEHNKTLEDGKFCIWLENANHITWGDIDYAENYYGTYKIITSTELIGNKIYELW